MIKKLNRFIGDYVSDTKGSFSQLFAVVLLPVLFGIGAAVDISRQVNAKATLQQAADSAALAAAILKKSESNSDTIKQVSETTYLLNAAGINNLTPGAFTAVKTSDDAVKVVAKSSLKPMFIQIGGFPNLNITVVSEAVAQTGETSGTPCITLLSKTRSPGLLFNSGAGILAPNCEVHVHSTRNPAATFNAGINIDVAKLCIAGNNVINNYGTVKNLETQCDVKGDPYASAYTAPAGNICDFNNGNYGNASVNMTPGRYCGWFNFNNSSATVNFAPGTYYIRNGGWNVNGGTWTANGVTFFFEDTSKIQFNSAVKADLKAPSTGPYAGFIFAEKAGLANSDFILNDSRGFLAEGIIHLPSRHVTLNSSSSVTSRKLDFVADSMIINTAAITIEPLTGSANSSSGQKQAARLTR